LIHHDEPSADFFGTGADCRTGQQDAAHEQCPAIVLSLSDHVASATQKAKAVPRDCKPMASCVALTFKANTKQSAPFDLKLEPVSIPGISEDEYVSEPC
jgi:hypothetical protein